MGARFKAGLVRLLLTVAMLAAGRCPVRAGAWLQPKGHGLLILSATMLSSGRVLDATGRSFAIPRYNKFQTDAWLEYGLTDRITLVLWPQLRSVSIASPIDASHTGAGYLGVGARVGLWSGKDSVFSLQPLVRFPGSRDESDPAQAGETQMEVELRALYGHSFKLGAWPAFFDTEFAYRFRSGDPPDEIHSDVAFGVRPLRNLLLMAQYFSTYSYGKARGYYVTGWEQKVALSAVCGLAANWSLQIGGVATVAGANTLAERGYFAAIWKRF